MQRTAVRIGFGECFSSLYFLTSILADALRAVVLMLSISIYLYIYVEDMSVPGLLR